MAETPKIKLYPVNPFPAFAYEGKMESKALVGKLSKMIPDHSTRITKETQPTSFSIMHTVTVAPTLHQLLIASGCNAPVL